MSLRFTCDQCKVATNGPAHRTITGRSLCGQCNDRLLGATVGLLAAGSGADTTTQIVSAVSTGNWFARFRRRRSEP